MAKCDILILSAPCSPCLLSFSFEEPFYVDKLLPMGCVISCAIFEKFSCMLEWRVQERLGLVSTIHYLNDFWGECSLQCQVLLDHFITLSQEYWVPLAKDKTFRMAYNPGY